MTLIGTTPLTRYPRLHPDMGYLRTIISPALNPMTLNDLLISNFQATKRATDSQGQNQRDPKTSGGGIVGCEQLPVTVGSRYIVPPGPCHEWVCVCYLTNATLPLGHFPESYGLAFRGPH